MRLYVGFVYADIYSQKVEMVEEFNTNRHIIVAISLCKVFEKPISAWCPHTTRNDDLINLRFIEW